MKLGNIHTPNVNYDKERPSFRFELVHGTCIDTIYTLYTSFSFELNSIESVHCSDIQYCTRILPYRVWKFKTDDKISFTHKFSPSLFLCCYTNLKFNTQRENAQDLFKFSMENIQSMFRIT